jgi:hypothetical protein
MYMSWRPSPWIVQHTALPTLHNMLAVHACHELVYMTIKRINVWSRQPSAALGS